MYSRTVKLIDSQVVFKLYRKLQVIQPGEVEPSGMYALFRDTASDDENFQMIIAKGSHPIFEYYNELEYSFEDFYVTKVV